MQVLLMHTVKMEIMSGKKTGCVHTAQEQQGSAQGISKPRWTVKISSFWAF